MEEIGFRSTTGTTPRGSIIVKMPYARGDAVPKKRLYTNHNGRHGKEFESKDQVGNVNNYEIPGSLPKSRSIVSNLWP